MDEITETSSAERDVAGRFLIGHKAAGPGRPKGARSKLGEAFIEDLRDCWERHGVTALERCATEEPAQFVRVVASLLPRDVNLNVGIDATAFADKFRAAIEALGNDPNQASQLSYRRPAKLINGRG